MKTLLLLIVLVLVSCGTLRTVGTAIMEDKTIPKNDRIAYAERAEQLERQFNSLEKYHYAALASIGIGAFIIFVRKGNTALGFGAVLFGVGISSWALYAPTHPKTVGLGVLGVLTAMCAYVVYVMVISTRGRREKILQSQVEEPNQ